MGKIAMLFSVLIAFSANALEVGDVLLQPLKCWTCSLIEQEENSDYSHMGIYLGDGKVAEAYADRVKIVDLEDFKSKTDPARKILVRRLNQIPQDFKLQLMTELSQYLNRPYDRWFDWKDDAIYCSELVYKILDKLVSFSDLAPKRMLFQHNPEYWDRYFQGQTPRGELGISPGDFELSSDFISVETI